MSRSRFVVVLLCLDVGFGCGSPDAGGEGGSSEGSSSESSSSSSSSSSEGSSSGGPSADATLLVTEFLANANLGPDSITDAQWVEIYNATAADIDLQGLTLAAAQSEVVIDASVVVPAGGFVLLAGSDTPEAGGAPVDWVWTTFAGLATQGGTVAIEDGTATIDAVVYAPGTFPPTVRGQALALDPGSRDPLANDEGANWCAADVAPGGEVQATPGAANPQCP